MPIRLMRKLLRERRRIALVAILLFAALRLAGPAPVAQPLPAAALALGLGWLFGVVAVLTPGLRGCCEAVALAGLAFAGLVRALPGSALDLAGPAGDTPLALGCWVGLFALVLGMRRALVVLPQPRLHNRRFKARAGSRVDISRLWYGLVPTPAQAARYGDPDLVAIEDMSLCLGRVRLVTQAAPEPPRETHLQILEVEAPFHIRLRACEGDGRGVMGATGVSEIFLIELGPRRLVLFAHEFPEMPLGRAILAWLDDTPGRLLDRRLAIIERRARIEDAGSKAPGADPAGARPHAGWDTDAARDAPTAPAHPTNQRRAP